MTRTDTRKHEQWRRRAGLAAVAAACAGAAVAQPDVRVVGLRFVETMAVQTNGEVEPGESGRIAVTLENRGDTTATGITGSIAVVPAVPGVSVTSGSTAWPDLAPGSRAEDLGTLALDVAAATTCGADIVAELTLQVAGGPATVAPLPLRVGFVQPVVNAAQWVYPFSDDRQMVAWGDGEYGMTWFDAIAPGNTYSVFQRVDAAGNPVGVPVPIPPTPGGDSPGVLCWGADRWAFLRRDTLGVRMATIARDGTIIGQWRLYTPGASERVDNFPTLAWDGAGWGVVFHVEEPATPQPARNQFTYLHVLPDGTVDAGPVRIDVGTPVADFAIEICWADDEFLVLAAYRVARIARDGQSRGVGPALPQPLGPNPRIAWSGRSLGVVSEGFSFELLFNRVSRDGVLEQPVTRLQYLRPNDRSMFWDRTAIAWDGTGFGIAGFGESSVFSQRDAWVVFGRVTETGRAWYWLSRTTPSTPDVTFWSLGDSMAWNPVNREYALPVISSGDPADALREGALWIQRIGQGASCVQGEPPREVSAPMSGSPLTVSVRIDWARLDHRRNVYVHFEDIGVEARAYNVLVGAGVVGGRIQPWSSLCGLELGVDPEIATEAPGRLQALGYQESENLGIGVRYFLVSASNAWGEGPKGSGTYGAPSLVTDACALTP